MSTHNEKEQQQKLIEVARAAIQLDSDLREKHHIGEKFRFVRDKLHALLDQLEKQINTKEATKKTGDEQPAEDEIQIYIYLFNAQGSILQSWLNMLTPKLFYEYSVNRPVYLEKAYIESLIRSKTNKVQHAFLTVSIKKKSLIESEAKKDVLGNPIVKIKEGSLDFNKLIAFAHNDSEYILDDNGRLEKKSPQVTSSIKPK